MTIRTYQSMSGFFAANPQLTFTERGDARLYARVGKEHLQRNDDGTFTKLETTFHNLVSFGKPAERAYHQFQKGDHFVAEGTVREYTVRVDGKTVEREEFLARKIGHDTTRTRYTVDRSRGTTPQQGQEVESEDRESSPETPETTAESEPSKPGDRLADIGAPGQPADIRATGLRI